MVVWWWMTPKIVPAKKNKLRSLIVQRLIKYYLKHRYWVNIAGKKTLQNRTEQLWFYNVVILIMNCPKYSRTATLLHMPLIRPRDEKEKVIKKERNETNQGKACCYNKLFKVSRVSRLWRQYKTESMPQETPNHQHLYKFLNILSGILWKVFLSHHSLYSHPIPTVTPYFLPIRFWELSNCFSSVIQDAVFSYVSQLISEECL